VRTGYIHHLGYTLGLRTGYIHHLGYIRVYTSLGVYGVYYASLGVYGVYYASLPYLRVVYMPPYRTSGCIYASLGVLTGLYASLGVLTRVYASQPPVSLLGVYHSLSPTTRFTVGCVPQPLSYLPVSLLGVPQPLSHHPFHCWVFPSLSLLSRFTVGQEKGLFPLLSRFTVGLEWASFPPFPVSLLG